MNEEAIPVSRVRKLVSRRQDGWDAVPVLVERRVEAPDVSTGIM
jgi:hypothetical protein